MYHYYLCRIKDGYLRIGIQGDPQAGLEYVQSLVPDNTYHGLGYTLKSNPEVFYIDEFYYPIKSDIDEWMGLGCKIPALYPNISVVTCKHIRQLGTSKKGQLPFLEQMQKLHDVIKKGQKDLWEAQCKREAEVLL